MGFAFEAEVALGGGKKAEKAEQKGENSLFFFSVEGNVGCKLTLSLEAKNGVIMRAEKNDGTLQHPCDVCRSGVASLKFELSGKIVSKFKFLNISPLESGLEGELPLADYYFSKIDGTRTSGYGICPNIRYRANITVMDLDGNRLNGVQVKIRDRTTDEELDLSPPVISDSSGLAHAYLPNGIYRLTGTYTYPGGDISGSQDVEIDDAPAQVQLLIDAGSMRRVTLTFVTSSGQPLAGLTVQGTGMDKAPVTDGNGQVTYYAAASHRTVTVEDTVNDLYWSGTVDVGNADVEKTITVERRTYAILFKISDQDGKPVSDATLTAAKSDFEITVNVMGGEAACSLPNGSYLVTVTKDGVETRNTIQVQGKTETFRFTLIPASYTITFNANGGAVTTGSMTVASGRTLSSPPTATRDGYTFAGWNTAADGSGNAFTVNTPVTENITVYAQWKSTEQGITWNFDKDTGTLTISGSSPMENYTSTGYTTNTPWRPYYKIIQNVKITDGVTTIGNYAFYECASLASVTIPDSVTSIGRVAFARCYDLASVIIPNSVTSIGKLAFQNCSGLIGLTIPNSVTFIGSHAFQGCRSLTNVVIPDSVTSIDMYAFSDCRSLTSVTIPNSMTRIEEGTFDDCESLTSVTIPGSVTVIGSHAFHGCESLASVTIPSSVTWIGHYAFYNCKSLNSLTIPYGVTSIGENAFGDCKSLTSVTIPNSVTSIGKNAFNWCYNLKAIYYQGTQKQWASVNKGYYCMPYSTVYCQQ